MLRERLGHHIHGELWAQKVKKTLNDKGLLGRPLHIISANMHSVLNSLFALKALEADFKGKKPIEVFEKLSSPTSIKLQQKVSKMALANGMTYIEDDSGANINVQIFDTAKFQPGECRN